MAKTNDKQKEENFEVRNEEIEKLLRDIGHLVGNALPEGWVFNLLIASVGEKGSTFYISNGVREDMIKLMIEFVSKQMKGGGN